LRLYDAADANDWSVGFKLALETFDAEFAGGREELKLLYLRLAPREDSDRTLRKPDFGELDETRQGGQRSGGDRIHRHQRVGIKHFDSNGMDTDWHREHARDIT
jgi:hypothetical protein